MESACWEEALDADVVSDDSGCPFLCGGQKQAVAFVFSSKHFTGDLFGFTMSAIKRWVYLGVLQK